MGQKHCCCPSCTLKTDALHRSLCLGASSQQERSARPAGKGKGGRGEGERRLSETKYGEERDGQGEREEKKGREGEWVKGREGEWEGGRK